MIQHVLVPLDGSPLAESALTHARAVARAFGAKITLLRVQEPNAKGPGGVVDALRSRFARAECGSYVEGLVKRLRDQGLRANGVAAEGDPSEEILRTARDSGVDLLVLSWHGRGGPEDPVLGATALKVLARSPVSVLLTRAAVRAEGTDGTSEIRYRRIMAPLDCSQRAHWALLQAMPLAQAQSSELLLVHVVSPPTFARRTPPLPHEIALARQLAEEDRRLAERYLADTRRSLGAGGLSVRTLLLESSQVVQTLDRAAREEDVDLVVVSAHGISGLAPWPYGSVADRLIHYGGKPLLVLQDAAAGQGAEQEPAARVA